MSILDAPAKFPSNLVTLEARPPVDGCSYFLSGDGTPQTLPTGAKYIELSLPTGSSDGWFKVGGDNLTAAAVPTAAVTGTAPRDLPAGSKIVIDVRTATKYALLTPGPYLLAWWLT